jgi:hypothetical protein
MAPAGEIKGLLFCLLPPWDAKIQQKGWQFLVSMVILMVILMINGNINGYINGYIND